MDVKRVGFGFAVAPLPILAVPLLMFALAGAPTVATLQVLLFGYGATLLIGLPVHLILVAVHRRGLVAYLAGTAAGVLLAAAVAAAFDSQIFGRTPDENPFGLTMWSRLGVTWTAVFLCLACFTAWLFWTVAVRPPAISKSKP